MYEVRAYLWNDLLESIQCTGLLDSMDTAETLYEKHKCTVYVYEISGTETFTRHDNHKAVVYSIIHRTDIDLQREENSRKFTEHIYAMPVVLLPEEVL